ncbi:MAG: hypothetical protein AABY22_04730, partial [Nanoarchaeota archaeon]
MIYDNTTKTDYSVLDLGFDKNLTKNIVGAQGPIPTPELVNVFTSGLAPKNLNSGELISTLEQQVGVLFNGKIAFDNTQTGYRLGIDISDELVKFYIGNTTNYLNWTGTALVIAGSLSASSIDIPDTTTANSFHVNSSGDAWWGATTFAASVASVSKAGAAIFTNVKITGVQTGSSIDGQFLAALSVASAAVAASAITTAKIAALAVTSAELA